MGQSHHFFFPIRIRILGNGNLILGSGILTLGNGILILGNGNLMYGIHERRTRPLGYSRAASTLKGKIKNKKLKKQMNEKWKNNPKLILQLSHHDLMIVTL